MHEFYSYSPISNCRHWHSKSAIYILLRLRVRIHIIYTVYTYILYIIYIFYIYIHIYRKSGNIGGDLNLAIWG